MPFLKTVETYQQGARTLPGRYYTAPEVFAEERERIFRRNWICVGRDAALADAGDYRLVEIAGESIIVLRDQSGERHAYYNVCRHRGTRLCEAPTGRLSETIQCPYHAWTYALDGRLIGAPHMHEVEGFDKKAYPPTPSRSRSGRAFCSRISTRWQHRGGRPSGSHRYVADSRITTFPRCEPCVAS